MAVVICVVNYFYGSWRNGSLCKINVSSGCRKEAADSGAVQNYSEPVLHVVTDQWSVASLDSNPLNETGKPLKVRRAESITGYRQQSDKRDDESHETLFADTTKSPS